MERAQHDAGVQMETWKQYDLRPTNMSHANGYPVELPRWWRWQNTYEVQTAVAYIGWGGASVAAGIYAVHFDGNGTLSFGGDARLAAPLSYDPVARRGRYLFNVSAPTSGVSIRIMTTDPSAPLKNVRVIRVEDEVRSAGSGSGSAVSAITSINVDATDAALAAQPFHPDLLNALNGTRLLRFCGWALIDSNDYNENNFRPAWRDRSTPASLTQAGPRGVALEYMVALANMLNASAWFCMPRSNAMDPSLMTTTANGANRPGAADEADLGAYATYVDSHLRPHLTAFVEYRTDAANRNEAPQTHAIESLEIFRAWTLAFGANATRPAALGTRLVRVSGPRRLRQKQLLQRELPEPIQPMRQLRRSRTSCGILCELDGGCSGALPRRAPYLRASLAHLISAAPLCALGAPLSPTLTLTPTRTRTLLRSSTRYRNRRCMQSRC